MPSSNLSEDDIPSDTLPKRKASGQVTPQRATALKRVNGASPKTPIRKVSGNVIKTPNTAPARTKTGKKAEPTLLGDFLLGRPSPARQRRKSLDVVKQELKQANIETIKLPGGVKDRVQQWQKASSAAIIEDPEPVAVKEKRKKGEVNEDIEDESVDDAERTQTRNRGTKRPGRRKAKEEVEDGEESENKSRSQGAPRKRVISDEHWMKARNARKSPPNKRTPSQKIPKDFLVKTVVKEPLGQRVQDWIKSSEGDGTTEKDVNIRIRKPSRQGLSSDENQKQIRSNLIPLGIQVNPKDDGIRIKPSEQSLEEAYVGEGIRVKPVRKDGSKRRPRGTDEGDSRTTSWKHEDHNMPSVDDTPKSRASSNTRKILYEADDKFSSTSLSPQEKFGGKPTRTSGTPSDFSEIPFGNSAFSVLDLPVGAEAGTIRRPPPRRNPSFGVPKVLKKVYNAVHDGPDPARTGPNQPASIESWLKNTSDPFVERPSPPQSAHDDASSSPSRNVSYKEDDQRERELTADHRSETGSVRRRRVRASMETPLSETKAQEGEALLESPKTRDTLPSMEQSPPTTPMGLKRRSATRNTSTPKAARKSMFKSAIFDAFKGESEMAGQTDAPNPFAEITGNREDINRSPEYRSTARDQDLDREEDPVKRASRPHESSSFDQPSLPREKPLPFPRGPPPTSGGHRLSTIASVETFSTSSTTDTASQLSNTLSALSQTTVTQATVLTQTSSSLSRKSNKPKKPSGNLEMKRRLTKHSDLLSVLSLPDAVQQGRSKSIRSARSVRTTRAHLETATVQDMMREVSEDEVKYLRELRTLVDGVIPVLLTCVLSKSDSAVAAGLFNTNKSTTDASITKPIVDMGVALERLKSLHKRIPIDDANAFVTWASQAHKTYYDYLSAWRTGFQDVVVNLAPASRSVSVEQSVDEIPRNANGDVVGSNGERVDVAYLLKRPLVRVKYINRAMKGLVNLYPTAAYSKVKEDWETLENYSRTRVKQEEARLVDQAANTTDPTRARDPRTLVPAEDVQIDQTRQVYAKDYFSLDISHSNGQRIECRVEVILRDKTSDSTDADVLICEVSDVRRFLLFPPVSKALVSARLGDHHRQVVVMIRGVHDGKEWHETFLLEAEDDGAAIEWIDMLGTIPVPPQVTRKAINNSVEPTITLSKSNDNTLGSLSTENDIPLGERRRREAGETAAFKKGRPRSSGHTRASSTVPGPITQDSITGEPGITDLNDAMQKAGSPVNPKRARAARYHSRTKSSPSNFVAEMSGGLDPYPNEPSVMSQDVNNEHARGGSPDPNLHQMGLPFIPKIRSAPSTPLKEFMRPEPDIMKKQPVEILQEDEPPPPPPHRTLTPNGMKSPPALDTPTPRAKTRRSSSPLKHEYQPSDASYTSSSSEQSESDSDSDSDSYSESSDEDELEAAEIPTAPPSVPIYDNKRISPPNSINNTPGRTLPFIKPTPSSPHTSIEALKRNVATVSGWSDKDGRWIDIHPEPCSIILNPGRLRVYELNAAHSSPSRDGPADPNASKVSLSEHHILDQVLTPVIPLRKSTAVDIEIQSAPSPGSRSVARSYRTIRYRTANAYECETLYRAIHQSRLDNPVYKKLEEDRRISGFGTNTWAQAKQDRRRSWMFGRKRSYRASTRAPSEIADSERSGNTHSSAFSALRRLSSGGMFNIAKSSIDRGSIAPSNYTSNPSDWSGPTPPRTPTSPSLMGSSYSTGMSKNLGSDNLKIRLYRLEMGGKWNDFGAARLSITIPPQGMRQASALYHGIERRIVVVQKQATPFFNLNISGDRDRDRTPTKADDLSSHQQDRVSTLKVPNPNSSNIILDIILGAECYTRIGRTGVAVNIWEDIVGDNGEVGMVGKAGGVSGRTRKWLFQTACAADANWIYSLVAVGR